MPESPDLIERFLGFPDNRATLPGLIKAMETGVVPFVGGSLTRELGLPSPPKFFAALLEQLGIPVKGSAEQDLKTLRSVMGELYIDDQLVVEFGNDRLPSPIRGIIALIPYVTRDYVITTTISQSVEAAFHQASAPYVVASTDEELADLSPLGVPRLIKLNGDVYGHPARHIDVEGMRARLEKARAGLTEIVRTRTLLFLDAHLRAQLSMDALAPTPPLSPQDHYALLPDSERGPEAVRALYPRRIRPVWYPDEPDALARVLDHLIRRNPHPRLGVPPVGIITIDGPPAEESTWVDVADIAPVAAVTTAPPDMPISVPLDLIAACAKQECVAFVGSGLGARAGLPTWVEFVEGMLTEAVRAKVLSPENAESQRAALQEGDVNAVADNVVSAFTSKRDQLIDYYRRANATTRELPGAFTTLRQIPFAGVMTSNYDDLLDRTYADRGVLSGLTPDDSEKLLELLATRERPFVLKLYGDVAKPQTLVLAPNDYQTLVRSNAAFARFIESLFFSRTLLFLGVSLDGLTDYLSAFTFPSGIPRQHYALMAVSGRGWEAKAAVLQRRYNIRVIPFPKSATFPEVDQFLADLLSGVAAGLRTATPAVTAVGSDALPPLRRLTLRDIGPFKHLELSFTEPRKVLLGDNGVGKSSILRAIAVAIVGSDARHSAGRLIRAGQSSGSITLTTAKNPSGYVTEIQRVGSGADVVSLGGRPLESENWLALGFPPLRTSSPKPLKGPQGMITRRPDADDLLPIITGDIDVRLDDLKQWLVNTEAIVTSQTSTDDERSRAKALKARFFEIVRNLTDDPVLDLAEITTDYKVMVKTRDGNVSIELLSQGMSSLLSWVGILVQRLYEVHYGNANVSDPTKEYTLVLMDEIDAHMHPRWQQQLLDRLKTLFPRIQIIVSTHSPLVVAGLPPSQVVRFVRQGDEITMAPLDDDTTLGRADQILTSDLFGLDSTLALGDETNALLEEYETLLGKSDRNAEQQKRYNELVRIIGPRLPSAIAENKLQRRTHQLVQAIITADYSPDKLGELREKLVGATREVARSLGLEQSR